MIQGFPPKTSSGGVLLLGILLLVGAGLGACSAPALPGRLKEAIKAEHAGDLSRALVLYTEVFRGGKKSSDRAVAGLYRGGVLVALGQYEKAVEAYLAVAQGPGSGTREAARALYRAGCVLADNLGRPSEGLALFKKIIDTYPDSVAGDDAVQRIVLHYRERKGFSHLVAYLKERFEALEKKEVADNLLWAWADVLEKDLGMIKEAVEIYDRIAYHYPDRGLADDAAFRAAHLYRKLKYPMEALVRYKKILRTRIDAWIVGSFHSELLDDAQLQYALTWLEDLHRPDKAIPELRALVNDFPKSVLRDDALWWIALAELRRGRREAAQKIHSELRRRFPRSKLAYQGKALLGWWKVALALAKKDSHRVCETLVEHGQLHRSGWFRKRRRDLYKHHGCRSKGMKAVP